MNKRGARVQVSNLIGILAKPKRSISEIVAVVLVMLVVIVAVAIIWLFVIPLIKDRTITQIGVADLEIVSSEGYTLYDSINNLSSVQIKRSENSQNLSGIQVVFSIRGNSVLFNISKDDVPKINEAKMYKFNLTGIGKPESVSIYPILSDGKAGSLLSSFKFVNNNGFVNLSGEIYLRNGSVINPALCVENWNCTNLTSCISSQQSRTCKDLNNCGTNLTKPDETQTCICIPETCSSLGKQCGIWSNGCNLMLDCGTCPTEEYYLYSDVLLICNPASTVSVGICNYFVEKRISKGFLTSHVLNLTNIPASELVSDADYNSIKDQIGAWLSGHNNETINYIVTTKGVPLRTSSRSIDSLLVVAFGTESPSYYNAREIFNHTKFKSYLVTRLDGVTLQDVSNLIDNAGGAAYNSSGYTLLNCYSTYIGYGDWGCSTAYMLLNASGFSAELNNYQFIKNRNKLMGYWSWGSNACGIGSSDPACANSSAWNLTFLPEAIAETGVSTSARTLNSYWTGGQSLITDLIHQGITGVKGYVYEPYSGALAHPDILFNRYTAGYNLADSFYMASSFRNWMDVIIGDPKTHIKELNVTTH